jgi:NitT/TauT family transport system permease protein
MAVDQALHGLDSLETQPGAGAGSDAGRLASRAWAGLWPRLLAIVLVLVVWQLIHLTGWKHYVFQGPAVVLSQLWHMLQHGQLWGAIAITMRRALIGYTVALVIGSVIGILVARIPPLRAATGSIISALLTMPSIAWYPLAIILYGPSTSAIIFVMVLGGAPSIANGLITGVDYTPPLLLRAAKTMGLRGVAKYRFLVLPASLPAYVAGLRQGWAFAWRSLMAGELLVIILGQVSIGELLNDFEQNQQFAGEAAMMIVILLIGVIVDAFFTKADLTIRRRRGLVDATAG